MKTILFSLLLGMTLTSHAVEVVGLKNFKTVKSGTLPDLTASEVRAMWASSNPACIKDGGRVLAVNQAFNKSGFKSSQCASSEAKKKMHRKLGITVYVIKAYQLPKELLK